MQHAVAHRRSNVVVTGIVAGLLGGALIDAFLAIANQANLIQIWQFVASAVVGNVAYTAPNYALLGFTLHFAVSIAWAGLYAWAALGPMPALSREAVLSGLLYGIVVMLGMTTLLAVQHLGPAGDAAALIKSVIAHSVFFGLPVALYVKRAANG